MSNGNPYELSQLEQRSAIERIAVVGGWVFLAALLLATGIHAVSLVATHTHQGAGFMYAVRIAAPVLVEIFAGLTAVGFAVHAWRAEQKLIGLAIELVWFLFASLNLVSSFTLEAGGQLPAALSFWLNYGLPVSMLVIGSMFYAMYRSDPVHLRAAELKAAREKEIMSTFTARRAVRQSPQMESIRTQQAWLEEIKALEAEGYTKAQIAFMLHAVPELKGLGHAFAVEMDTAAKLPILAPQSLRVPASVLDSSTQEQPQIMAATTKLPPTAVTAKTDPPAKPQAHPQDFAGADGAQEEADANFPQA